MDALNKCGVTGAEALAGAERGAALMWAAMTSRPPTTTCAHCGRPMGGYAGGWASITLDGTKYPLCHPNDPNRPDCYRLVTVYHETIGSRKEQR